MLKTSNYNDQSKNLSPDIYQSVFLKWTDGLVASREITKLGTLVGLVCSVSSCAFDFHPATPITWTAATGCTFMLFSIYSKKLEPQAQQMIEGLKAAKSEKNLIS